MVLDPIIISALTAGATALIESTATDTVKSTYERLKTLIVRKISGNAEAQTTLIKFEKKPQVWQEPLREELTIADVGSDPEVIAAARQLLNLIQPQQVGKYSNQIGSVGNWVQGDHASMRITNDGRSVDK